jgi:hypothetical protein
MGRSVALQLLGEAHLQMSPLADELTQLITLLPALQAVITHLLVNLVGD